MNEIIQLKIKLQQTEPVICRQIQVSHNTSFFELHNIIQITMGWQNYHLFEFRYDDYIISLPNPDSFDFDNVKIIDCREIALAQILTEELETILYVYDFGDGWRHEITVEKFIPKATKTKYPICIAGEMQCPPEDCGGVHGFHEMLTVLQSKKHNQKQEYFEWLGHEFIPSEFDLTGINKQLSKIKEYIKKVYGK